MSIETKEETPPTSVILKRAARRSVSVWLVGSPLNRSRKRRVGLITSGLVLMAGVLVICTTFGAVTVPVGDTFSIIWNHTLGQLFLAINATYPKGFDTVIWDIRVPRVLLAAVVGGSLATAGATYQGLFRNPLADPYLVGVAQGAAVGAILALVLPLGKFLYGIGAVQWFAFITAGFTVAIVYGLARVGGRLPTTTLLLAGIAIGTLASAITSLLMYLNGDKLIVVYSWLQGGFNLSSWEKLFTILPFSVLSGGIIYVFGRRLNVLQMGEEHAGQLGLNVERLKLVLVASATLMTAAAVSVSGIIGFVGLVAPHLVRLLFGHDYRLLLPLSTIFGAAFMVFADTVARNISSTEVPVGIITAFFGAPFFIFLLRRKKRMVF